MKTLSEKKFIAVTFLLTIGSFFAVWGFLIEPNRLLINKHELKLKKWSPKLNGFKIVAISDIHAGSNFITEEKIRRIVAEVNEQNPDITVLLGDYVSSTFHNSQQLNMPPHTIAENLSGLRAKHGVFAVLGNADEKFGAKEMRRELAEIGVKVLSNESLSIEVNGEPLRLLGMKDQMISGNWNDISRELKKVVAKENIKGNIIVLTHNPDYLPVITGDYSISEDISLILAGHTHGGQCRFPFFGALIVPSEYGQNYVAGHIHHQQTDMFVTTGIGTSKIPFRFGVPPEIAVLTIYTE